MQGEIIFMLYAAISYAGTKTDTQPILGRCRVTLVKQYENRKKRRNKGALGWANPVVIVILDVR